MLTPEEMDLLGRTQLLDGCDADTLERLRPWWNRKCFPAGTMLMAAGQPGEVVYVVMEGSVRIHLDGHTGNDIIIALRGPGEVVGELSLVDQQRHSAAVTVAEDSLLFWIGAHDFLAQVQTNPIVLLNLARILSQRLRLATSQIQAFNSLDVRGRIATQLLSLAREFGEEQADGSLLIPLHITQSDIGSMVGATKVSVNQTLAGWKKRRLVEIMPHSRLKILNPALLKREIQ